MILLGENHWDQFSLETEKMFIEIAHKELGMTTVLHEGFSDFMKKDWNDYPEYLQILKYQMKIFEKKHGKPDNLGRIELFLNELKLRMISIDFMVCFFEMGFGDNGKETCSALREQLSDKRKYYTKKTNEIKNNPLYANIVNIDDSWLFSLPELVKLRDEVMSDLAIRLEDIGDTVLIVGDAHLEGLQKNSSLGNHYYVLDINLNQPKCNSNPEYVKNFARLKVQAGFNGKHHYTLRMMMLRNHFCSHVPDAKPCQTLRKRTKPLRRRRRPTMTLYELTASIITSLSFEGLQQHLPSPLGLCAAFASLL